MKNAICRGICQFIVACALFFTLFSVCAMLMGDLSFVRTVMHIVLSLVSVDYACRFLLPDDSADAKKSAHTAPRKVYSASDQVPLQVVRGGKAA